MSHSGEEEAVMRGVAVPFLTRIWGAFRALSAVSDSDVRPRLPIRGPADIGPWDDLIRANALASSPLGDPDARSLSRALLLASLLRYEEGESGGERSKDRL